MQFLVYCTFALAIFLAQNALRPERELKAYSTNGYYNLLSGSCTEHIICIKFNMPALQVKKLKIKDNK